LRKLFNLANHPGPFCVSFRKSRNAKDASTVPRAPRSGLLGIQCCLREQRGFTLLELLVVIAILGLLIGLVAPAALRQLGSARVSVAKQSIERIVSVLDIYKLDIGNYPSSDQGLRALIERPANVSNWNGPYLKGNVPQDPWNHAYIYRDPSSRSGHDFDLCSEGPSANGGSDEICNQ
jgi:general secretion pathway protein G